MKYTLPFACRVVGASMHYINTTAQNHNIVLYDSSSNVLSQKAIDADILAGNFSSYARVNIPFDSAQSFAAGAICRLAFLPTTASGMTITKVIAPSSEFMKQMVGTSNYGNMQGSSRTDAGVWADDSDSYYPYQLIIDQIDVSSGGGMLVHPGMVGGIRA
jgi:hypothetical protein